MAEWNRAASTERFKFLGLRTRQVADALPEGKSPAAENIRAFNAEEITSRPQFGTPSLTTGTRVEALEPTLGVVKSSTSLYRFGSPAAIATGLAPGGASLTPFRPNASPNAWEYVWDNGKQVKVYPGPAGGAATVAKTGIAEFQSPPTAVVTAQAVNAISGTGYQGGGTSGGISAVTRSTDTVGGVFTRAVSATDFETTIQVSPTVAYQNGQNVNIGSGSASDPAYIVKRVFPPLAQTILINSIYYFSGTTGQCVVTPANLYSSSGAATFATTDALAAIIPGALVQIGTEVVLVRSVTLGPSGTFCFETSTNTSHTSGETLSGIASLGLGRQYIPGTSVVSSTAPTSGQTITSYAYSCSPTAGIGAITVPVTNNPFLTYSNNLFQPDDYLILQVNVADLTALTEIRLLLDVSPTGGNFTDFYFYSIRPNDLTNAIYNTSSSILAGTQIAAQRQAFNAEAAALGIPTSNQTLLGKSAWTTLYVRIKDFTRVGGNQTRTLQNIDYVRWEIHCTATVQVQVSNAIFVVGGSQLDVGTNNLPYFYRIRGRSSITGARGNPSPETRYGVYPRREQVAIALPAAVNDPQIDTFDIFRRGGVLEKPTYVGSVPVGTAVFYDNYADIALETNEELSFEHYEPFPSVGPSVTGTAVVSGTALTVTFPLTSASAAGTLSQIASLLPGNELAIGQQNFTLRARPTPISTTTTTQTWFMETVENAGAIPSTDLIIYEPFLAAQNCRAVWGPDTDGIFYAVGDPLRPGFVNHTNPNDPDSVSDTNATDICPPSEPLINGVLLNGTPIVFSLNRAWRGYPSAGKNQWREIPVGAGLAAPFGIATDGESVFYIAKDSIRRLTGGGSEAITDDDISSIFPQEGVQGEDYTYGGWMCYAPDYTQTERFRLSIVNRYLYFDYVGFTGTPHTLVYDLVTKGWSVDSASDPFTVHAGTTSNTVTFASTLYAGTAGGAVVNELPLPSASGEAVAATFATKEEMFGELRATKLYGDGFVDVFAASAITVTPRAFGLPLTSPMTQSATKARAAFNLSFNGEVVSRALGLMFNWTDTGPASSLYLWQLAYIVQPETAMDRFTDWDDLNRVEAKWIQGFILEADTLGVGKHLTIRDSDTQATHAFDSTAGTSLALHSGRSVIAYSITTPFIAHQVRIEPDAAPWQMWGVKWVWQPAPEAVFTWATQPTAHGQRGWQHVREVVIAHQSYADLTLTVSADGVVRQYVIANSGGQFRKTIVPLAAVKGMVWQYSINSPEVFRLWSEDMEFLVKAWGSGEEYRSFQIVGGEQGNKAAI